MANETIKPRDCSVEVARAIFMFAIVMQHVAGFGGYNIPCFTNVVDFGVAGFVLVSGWFGIRFSVWKLARLWAVAVWCAVVVIACNACFLHVPISVKGFFAVLYGWWFLNAYTILSLLAPVVNAGVESLLAKRQYGVVVVPASILLFGWIYPTTISPVAWLVPHPSGISTTSVLALLCIYVLARVVRHLGDEGLFGDPKRLYAMVAVSILGVAVSAAGLGSFSSPFAFVLVLTIFLLVRKVAFPQAMLKVVAWTAPSLFAVYLLHVNGFVWDYLMPLLERKAVATGCPVIPMFLIVSAALFVGCLAVDVPRRLGISLLNVFFRR